jgi:transposase-like protein
MGEASLVAQCPQCDATRTRLAYQRGRTHCYVCRACDHSWEMDTLPTRTTVH